MTLERTLGCQDVEELAGLYALGALEAAEAEQVRMHLETHPDVHAQCLQVVQAAASLAVAAPPVEPPAELRGRVLAAVRAAPASDPVQATEGYPASTPAPAPTPAPTPAPPAEHPGSWWRRAFGSRSAMGWGFATAAIVLLVAVAAWGLLVQRGSDETSHQLALLRGAITARSEAGTMVVDLTGADVAASAHGVVVLPEDSPGYLVLAALPAPEGTDVWQAWVLTGGAPQSAGLLKMGPNGLATLEGIATVPGTQGIALTLEPAGGSDAPTTTPLVTGLLQSA